MQTDRFAASRRVGLSFFLYDMEGIRRKSCGHSGLNVMPLCLMQTNCLPIRRRNIPGNLGGASGLYSGGGFTGYSGASEGGTSVGASAGFSLGLVSRTSVGRRPNHAVGPTGD